MSESCVICDEQIGDNTRQFSLSDRRKGLVGQWRLSECGSCGVVAMRPIPTDEQLAKYYASYYSSTVKISFIPKTGNRYPNLRKWFHKISGDVDPRDFVTVPKGGRVLDYGCGYGGYLTDFHERGIDISGAEISVDVVDQCCKHGYDVHKVDDFSSIPFKDEEFDVVYLMQVFEHLKEPHIFLNELSRILKRGGVLYIAVPNADSFWRRKFGENWVSGWFTPFHLYHYNSKSLSTLAEQHGFEVVKNWSNTPVMWFRLNLKAFLYAKENRLDAQRSWLDNRVVGYVLMLVLRIIELPVRQRDCLVVKLRKMGE